MKKFILPGFISIILLFSNSCSDDKDFKKTSEYLVFGHFYGECIGEGCVTMYKLEDDKLFQDTKKEYPRYDVFYEGSYIEMDQADYDKVKDLFDYFPEQLLYEHDTTFGCPDCADQGGLYIEYKTNNIHKYWTIDQHKGYVPVFLHDFIEKVNEKIDLLNN